MAGRFSWIPLAGLAALALLLAGGGALILPGIAQSRLQTALAALGFAHTAIDSTQIALGSATFRTVALDPDSLSTIGMIQAHYSPMALLFNARLEDVVVSDVVLTADFTGDSPFSLAGWSNPEDASLAPGDAPTPLPFERLVLKNARIDIATDAGGLGMGGDAVLNAHPDGALSLQSTMKAAQYQANFTLALTGKREKDGAWALAAEISEGKIALENLKVARLAGWIDVKSGQPGTPPSLTGQIAAGMIASGLIRLQELTATLEGTPQAPRVLLDGKAAGVPSLSLRAEMKDGAFAATLTPRNPGDLAEYLRLAGEASGKPLDPALIPPTFSGLSLRLARGPDTVPDSSGRRFSLDLADQDKTLSLHSDLLWDSGAQTLAGSVETGTLSAPLVSRLFPAMLPQGWSVEEGTVGIQGQITAAYGEKGLKISGPLKATLKGIGMESSAGVTASGIEGRIVFEGILPLATKGFQAISAARLDPGIPLESIRTQIHIASDGTRTLRETSARFAGGTIGVDALRMQPGKPMAPVTVRVKDVDLEKAARALSVQDLKTAGVLDGVLTLTRGSKGSLTVKGSLEGRKPGGTIRYAPEPTPAFLSGDDPGLQTTRLALQNFQYNVLRVELDGPLDGDLKARIAARGFSPEAFGTRPIELNLAVEGAIAPLLKLSSGR